MLIPLIMSTEEPKQQDPKTFNSNRPSEVSTATANAAQHSQVEEGFQKPRLSKRTLPVSVWVEILFVTLNVLNIIGAMWYVAIGLSYVGWFNSLASVVQTEETSYSMLREKDFDLKNRFILIITAGSIVALGCGICSYGAYQGRKYLIVGGFIAQIIVIPLEVYISESTNQHSANPICDTTEMRQSLSDLFELYGIFLPPNHTFATQQDPYAIMTSIQTAVGCCGLDGWQDYNSTLDESLPRDLDPEQYKRNISGIPNSCCKPHWAQNIYCGHDLQNSSEELRSSRLNEHGCVEKMGYMCERLVYLFINVIRLVVLCRLVIACLCAALAFLQIQAIQLIARGGNRGEDGTEELEDNSSLSDAEHIRFGLTSQDLPHLLELTENTARIMSVLRIKEEEDEKLGNQTDDESAQPSESSGIPDLVDIRGSNREGPASENALNLLLEADYHRGVDFEIIEPDNKSQSRQPGHFNSLKHKKKTNKGHRRRELAHSIKHKLPKETSKLPTRPKPFALKTATMSAMSIVNLKKNKLNTIKQKERIPPPSWTPAHELTGNQVQGKENMLKPKHKIIKTAPTPDMNPQRKASIHKSEQKIIDAPSPSLSEIKKEESKTKNVVLGADKKQEMKSDDDKQQGGAQFQDTQAIEKHTDDNISPSTDINEQPEEQNISSTKTGRKKPHRHKRKKRKHKQHKAKKEEEEKKPDLSDWAEYW